MLLKPTRRIDEPDKTVGICLWRLPSGGYIENSDGEYLSVGPCFIGLPKAEENLTRAVRSMGVTEGQPFWLPGFRKVSQTEWEDQMERLLEGKVPDLVDAYQQYENGES